MEFGASFLESSCLREIAADLRPVDKELSIRVLGGLGLIKAITGFEVVPAIGKFLSDLAELSALVVALDALISSIDS